MTEIVTGFPTKTSSIYLTVLACFGVSAPLWHVVYGVSLEEGVFGFRYMSSFLNALGSRLSLLCAGLFIVFFANKLPKEYCKAVKRIGMLFLAVSSFFLILIFFPKKLLLITFGIKDAHPIFYYGLMLIFSLSAAKIFQTLQNAIVRSEITLKLIIARLFKGYYEDLEKKDLINPWRKDEYVEFRVKLTEEVAKHEGQ